MIQVLMRAEVTVETEWGISKKKRKDFLINQYKQNKAISQSCQGFNSRWLMGVISIYKDTQE